MIEIIREQDELNRQVWKFWPQTSPHKVDIMLNEYGVERRATKRHKWQPVAKYDRFSRRSWHGNKYQTLEIAEVPVFPSDVVEEVMAKFMATVTVKREV